MVELADWQVPRMHDGVSLHTAAKSTAFPTRKAGTSRHLDWLHERDDWRENGIHRATPCRLPTALDKRNRPDKAKQLYETKNEISDALGTTSILREKFLR